MKLHHEKCCGLYRFFNIVRAVNYYYVDWMRNSIYSSGEETSWKASTWRTRKEKMSMYMLGERV
jgi:hypothetical protein